MIPAEALPPRVRVIRYTPDAIDEAEGTDDLDALIAAQRARGGVTWIAVQGLGDEPLMRRLGELFDLHRLTVEDLVNVPQRPKSEIYDNHHLFISRTVHVDADGLLQYEQIGIVVGAGYVLTVQDTYGDRLDPIRARLQRGGNIRQSGPDYLAYAIIDAVIDGYYPVMEHVGEHLSQLEDEVVERPAPATLHDLHRLKRDLMALRRAIWPQRDAINSLIRDESPFVSDTVRVYMRDCYDHAVQLIDVVETFRELAGGLVDLYLSSVSNRMNEVMKVLTVIATIFIPLSFIAGVYGMNFDHMPELHFAWSYQAVWLLMIAVAGAMLVYFRRRGWLGQPRQ